MVTRNKLELPLNKPIEVELLYDSPVVNNNTYGEYYLYALKNEDTEYAFFAPLEIHNELKNLKKGDTATITKLAAQRGSKLVTTYDVVCKPVNNQQSEEVEKSVDLDDGTNTKDPTFSDNYEALMLESLQAAIRIQEELGPSLDIMKIGVTLFIARSRINYTN